VEPLNLSHYGLVTCLGAGRAATRAALLAGRSGLKPCQFETAAIPTYVGEVAGADATPLTGTFAGFDCRNNRLAVLALAQDGFREAVAAAVSRYGAHRIALVLGTSTSGIHQTELDYRKRDSRTGALPESYDYHRTHNTFSLGRFLGAYLGIEGPALVISTACSTTGKVFASAARLIASGICDAAVVGGADSLSLTTLYGFRSLGLTAETPCRPFAVDRKGISLGEAAGFALLERADAGAPQGAVEILGVGESSDAYHMSSPHPEGAGARLAIERALASAGLSPGTIDYVNLHGTGTPVGDAAEDHAIIDVFGPKTPCSSTKGLTGHALGAAGIVEALICALSIEDNFMPGGGPGRVPDPAFRANYLDEGQSAKLDRVMSNAFGFGGSNCSVILGRRPC
jgi:3-oxoacyl-[acyl-carrier-protein] synthase-1